MLDIKNVSKTFNPGTVDEKLAMNQLSLHVNDGDFITIIGSNGAGKSTLFNIISGHILADEGDIYLAGEDVTYTPEHIRSKKIGRLFQDPLSGTAPSMTIEENMALAYLKSHKTSLFSSLSRKEREMFAQQLSLLDMGLENRMKTPVGLLSGGQRQALTLLMATMSNPKILLLDEHTAALDPGSAEKVLQLTQKIVEENNITTMMITHNMHQALQLGNRILMMADGKIVFDCSGEEKKKLTVEDLLSQFEKAVGSELDNDRIRLM